MSEDFEKKLSYIKNYKFDFKLAFTLAEVLITLAIIGVVAALTIPTLVKNYQKQQTAIKIKKVYMTLSNTTNLAIKDHGPIKTWEVGANGNGTAAYNFMKKYINPYLRISKDCGTSIKNNCSYKIYKMNGDEYNYFHSGTSKIYLADGTFIGGYLVNKGNVYLDVTFDLNGPKKPNKLGYDIFILHYDIKKGVFVPYNFISLSKSCKKQDNGYSCLNMIMKNNWQIPTKEEYVSKFKCNASDYPW